ncbi:MAG: TraB/GumN family protein [Janthinobacterium lividum]
MKTVLIGASIFCALILAPAHAAEPARADTPAAVQATPLVDPDAVAVEEVVVSARRSGLPMWTVRRGDEGVLILAGTIREVPRGFIWREEALASAVERVDRVLVSQNLKASPADIMRMLWRARTIVMLPDNGTLDQVLSDGDYARLLPLMAAEKGDGWKRVRPLMVAMDLVQDQAGERQSRDPGVERIVRRMARRVDRPVHQIGIVRGEELVETLISSPPSTQVDCLRAAMAAAEYGPTAMQDRAQAWARLDVKAVLASPLDEAMDECWPWGDPAVRGRMRQEWVAAISTAVSDQGVTLALAPVRTLGEPDGVLDQLVSAGFEVDGPEWK